GPVDAGGAPVGVHVHVGIHRPHVGQVADRVGGAHHEVVPAPQTAGHGAGDVQAGGKRRVRRPVEVPVDRRTGSVVRPGGVLVPGAVRAPTGEDRVRQLGGAAGGVGRVR